MEDFFENEDFNILGHRGRHLHRRVGTSGNDPDDSTRPDFERVCGEQSTDTLKPRVDDY